MTEGREQRVCTHLFVPREHLLIGALDAIHVFKGGYNQGSLTAPKPIEDALVAHDCAPEVGAESKIDVEDHDKVCAGEEAGDVAPGVELAVERVDDKVEVDVEGHEWSGSV
jgi:hypothetical protein